MNKCILTGFRTMKEFIYFIAITTLPRFAAETLFEKIDLTFAFDSNASKTQTEKPVIGTHMKTPAKDIHVPLDRLIAYPYIVDVSGYVWSDPGFQLEIHHLQDVEHEKGEIPEHSALLVYTGWCLKYKNLKKYFGIKDFSNSSSQDYLPSVHPDAVTWLIAKRKISSIISDTTSVDFGQNKSSSSQSILHSENVPLFLNVNLTSIEGIKQMKKPLIIALPLKIQIGTTVIPVRIVAMETKNLLVLTDGYLFVFGIIALTIIFHFTSRVFIGY